MSRIVRVFPDTHMGFAHKSLQKLAKDYKVDLTKLSAGEFVVFLSKDLRACKIYCQGNTFAYFRSPNGQRIEMKTIQSIPHYFRGGKFEYDEALAKLLGSHAKLAA